MDDKITAIYQGVYSRNPSPTEFQQGEMDIKNGLTYDQLLAKVVTLAIRQIYQKLLHRAPAAGEIVKVRASFAQGLHYAQVLALLKTQVAELTLILNQPVK